MLSSQNWMEDLRQREGGTCNVWSRTRGNVHSWSANSTAIDGVRQEFHLFCHRFWRRANYIDYMLNLVETTDRDWLECMDTFPRFPGDFLRRSAKFTKRLDPKLSYQTGFSFSLALACLLPAHPTEQWPSSFPVMVSWKKFSAVLWVILGPGLVHPKRPSKVPPNIILMNMDDVSFLTVYSKEPSPDWHLFDEIRLGFKFDPHPSKQAIRLGLRKDGVCMK